MAVGVLALLAAPACAAPAHIFRLPAEPVDTAEVSRRLTAAGLEVESVESVGHDIRGVLVAQVLSIEELTEDIAAERMATMRNPFKRCGTSVIMKIE